MSSHNKELLVMMEKAAQGLVEHADAILILASGPSVDKEGGTCFFRVQKGNLHACEGVAQEYLRRVQTYEGGYHGECGRRDAAHDNDGFE